MVTFYWVYATVVVCYGISICLSLVISMTDEQRG